MAKLLSLFFLTLNGKRATTMGTTPRPSLPNLRALVLEFHDNIFFHASWPIVIVKFTRDKKIHMEKGHETKCKA